MWHIVRNVSLLPKYIKLLFWGVILLASYVWGHAVAQFVEALRYKPEGRGFDSLRCY
jgi:hypothetical protein